jgi:serine protease Do
MTWRIFSLSHQTRPIRRLALASFLMASTAVGLALSPALPMASAQAAVSPSALPGSFSSLVKQVSPAVVTITAEKTVQADQQIEIPDFPFNAPPGSPFGELFRHFKNPRSGSPESGGHMVALGSGFIIDASGYVVTNNHVIEGAQNISIALSDGQQLDAELVGADDKTDIALLKVKSDKPLPAVSFGDSDGLDVGDWVVAVGNPFGLGGTVTAGIVSARGRDIRSGPFDDFIQTDASINKGNSGGPMFAADGTVMGINTAIYSPNGGSVGIGFAIPANVARPVIDQLKANGTVERGWLGVTIQPVTKDMAEALGVDADSGALVAEVNDGSPADKAGLASGDVITMVNDQAIAQPRDLSRLIAAQKPGSSAEVVVLRDGDSKTLDVTLGRMPGSSQVASAGGSATEGAHLGLALRDLDPKSRQQLGLDDTADGALVAAVDPQGPAAERGIQAGDVIRQVDRKAVHSAQDVVDRMKKIDHDKETSVLLLVTRDGHNLFVAVPVKDA